MSDNSNGTTVESLQNINGVGPAFAERLQQSGFTSVAEVGETEVKVLANAMEIAESRARTIQQSARDAAGLADDDGPGVAADSTDKVAVVWGKGSFDDVSIADGVRTTKDALADAGVDVNDTVLGIRGSGDGEVVVRETVRRLATAGAKVGLEAFNPMWDDYERGNYAEMFAVRDQAMHAWADEVIVVKEGEYTTQFLRRNFTDTPASVFLERNEALPAEGASVTDEEPETTDSGHEANPNGATDDEVEAAVADVEDDDDDEEPHVDGAASDPPNVDHEAIAEAVAGSPNEDDEPTWGDVCETGGSHEDDE